MAHSIRSGPQPNIICVNIMGLLEYEDMTCDEEIGLHDKPLFIFLDVSMMDRGLPEDFLDGARHSFFVHPNMMHLAIFTNSTMLDMIAKMVGKVTMRQDKITMHKSPEDALEYLLSLQPA